MSVPRLTLVTILLAGIACDLHAQRPRRFPRPGGGDGAAMPASATPAAPPKRERVENWTAVQGADVYLGTGEVLRRATVLIGDDKIQAVGHNLELPAGTKVIDAKDRVVAPGYVAVRCQPIGIGNVSGGNLADAVNPFDPTIKMALAAGITSYLYSGGGSGPVPGGKNGIVKLAWGDAKGMVVEEEAVLRMSVPLDPQQWEQFRELVKKAKDHKKNAGTSAAADASREGRDGAREGGAREGGREGRDGAAAAGGREGTRVPPGTEPILKLLEGQARLWIGRGSGGIDMGMGGRGGGGGSFDTDEIRQALEISELLGVGVVLEDPVTAWLIPDEIAKTGSMVVLSPRHRVPADRARPDTTGSNIAAAAILADAGVPVAVSPRGGGFGGGPSVGTGGILGQDLNTPQLDAAFAVRGGMDGREALRTITIDAARAIHADARVGSLEPGKDADLLILDGDPLHYRTFVQVAIVNGKVVYEKDKEPFYKFVRR